MEYLQARLDSFNVTKTKRTKASSSKTPSSKWPHPSSFKATPNSLAEAGFYYSDAPDNVTCFMCNKGLGGWEPDDDPFEIHYEKCRDVCSWAVVRCQKGIGEEEDDSTRHPTSKLMEKARLGTFSKHRWPHDAVKGHGANSKALARAGFVCNPAALGDDTVICLYCNLSLGGWDEDDDPYEEHLKRDKKNKTLCAFLKAYAGNSLNKSTAKRPASKAAHKAPSQTASQTLRGAAARRVAEERSDTSDDELAVTTSDLSLPPLTSSERGSRGSTRASTTVTKTPASRRSTRGTSSTGKRPGSKTVSSEVEETDAGSESDAGRRSTKSKRKVGGRTKIRVSAIAEEEEGDAPGHADVEVDQDVEMHETEPAEKEKKKRGRPPKAAVAKPAAKGKKAKEEGDEEGGVETDVEPAPPPPARKGHGRTRSKADLEPEAETIESSSMKDTHPRTKSGTKGRVKQDVDVDEPDVPVAPTAATKKKGRPAAMRVRDEEDDVASVPTGKAKPKRRAVSRSKAKTEPRNADVEDVEPVYDGERSRSRTESGRSSLGRNEPEASDERKSSLSEDAGYATAEPPPEPENMEVDEAVVPPRPKEATVVSKPALPPSRANFRATPIDSNASKRAIPAVNGIKSSTFSRTSSSRPPSTLNKDSLKVIEIDSDGEQTGVHGVPSQAQLAIDQAPLDRLPSAASLKAARKPSNDATKRKLQVEVVLPPSRSSTRIASEDVQMHDASPARPRTIPSDDILKSEPPCPGTPMSAVHRSASPPSPIRARKDVAMVKSDPKTAPAPATSSSPRVYHPYLAQVPTESLSGLTEEEATMTLEQYVRREMEVQYAQLRADAKQRIEEFKQKAAETRSVIESA